MTLFSQLYPNEKIEKLEDQKFQTYIWLLSLLPTRFDEFRNIDNDLKKKINPDYIPAKEFFDSTTFQEHDIKCYGATAWNFAYSESKLNRGKFQWNDFKNTLRILHDSLKDTDKYISLHLCPHCPEPHRGELIEEDTLMYFILYKNKGNENQLFIDILERMIKYVRFNINQRIEYEGENYILSAYILTHYSWKQFKQVIDIFAKQQNVIQKLEVKCFMDEWFQYFYDKGLYIKKDSDEITPHTDEGVYKSIEQCKIFENNGYIPDDDYLDSTHFEKSNIKVEDVKNILTTYMNNTLRWEDLPDVALAFSGYKDLGGQLTSRSTGQIKNRATIIFSIAFKTVKSIKIKSFTDCFAKSMALINNNNNNNNNGNIDTNSIETMVKELRTACEFISNNFNSPEKLKNFKQDELVVLEYVNNVISAIIQFISVCLISNDQKGEEIIAWVNTILFELAKIFLKDYPICQIFFEEVAEFLYIYAPLNEKSDIFKPFIQMLVENKILSFSSFFPITNTSLKLQVFIIPYLSASKKQALEKIYCKYEKIEAQLQQKGQQQESKEEVASQEESKEEVAKKQSKRQGEAEICVDVKRFKPDSWPNAFGSSSTSVGLPLPQGRSCNSGRRNSI